MKNKSFSLAPMTPSILVLTLVLWLLPLSFLLYSIAAGQQVAGMIALFLFALYGAVWGCCRPSRFVIAENNLQIVFPSWRRNVSLKDIVQAQQTNPATFKQEYGWAMRIGVGGLWGGFGWLWTSKNGLVEFYVSRVDGLVLIERKEGKNILITPDDPEGFVSYVQGVSLGMPYPQE